MTDTKCVMCGDKNGEEYLVVEGNAEMGLYNYNSSDVPIVCSNCESTVGDDMYSSVRLFLVGPNQAATVFNGEDGAQLVTHQFGMGGFDGFRKGREIAEVVEQYLDDGLSGWEEVDVEGRVRMDEDEIKGLDIDGVYFIAFGNNTKVYKKK